MFPGKKLFQLSNNQKIELYASMKTKNALKPIFSEVRETGVRMKAVPIENKRGEDFYHHQVSPGFQELGYLTNHKRDTDYIVQDSKHDFTAGVRIKNTQFRNHGIPKSGLNSNFYK